VINTEKSTLLVVDDNPTNIELLCGMLNKDYLLQVANSGTLALKIVAAHPPDLILLDVMMPEMNGYDVCIKLKGNALTRNIPVIFVSALTECEDEMLGFEMGAADYITKPVNPAVVRARVKSHLALSDQRRHLEQLVMERTREIETNYFITIQQLGRASDYRDNETGKHVLRVGNFSKLLGLASGFMEDKSELLKYAAMLHDIGKIGIRDHILLKPGKLTSEEFEIMKTHAEIGAQIIGDHDSEMLQMAKLIARSHHEKWDGSGYPYGLSGEDIPIVGRIVAIADVFDALHSVRPYKTAWTIEGALELIAGEAGRHFDPKLVALFLGLEADVRQIALDYREPE
jgi:putative two-component system response regulator